MAVVSFALKDETGMIWSNELENDIVTVSKLQVALSAEAHSIQARLTELTLSADTESQEGLVQLMQDSIQALLENSEYWTHVLASSETVSSREEAETVFNRLSLKERSKFSAETLSNVDGEIAQRSAVEVDSAEGITNYIVVTLLIGTADDQPLFDNLKTVQALTAALEKVAAMPFDYLMVFELLWSPQAEIDTLSQEELLTEYGDLVEIT